VLLTHAQDRAIREKVWRGGNGNSVDGPRDNRPILFEIVQLRNERAKLLGYQTHAHYVIDGRMAETPEKAVSFLEGLSKSYYPHAVKDLKDIRELAGHEIEPWDLAFYSNKLSEQRFGFSDQELKPYFPIDQVLKGAFYVAKKLYGVTFHVRKDLPAWDPSVQVFEVRDREDKYLALFYFDPYPRKSKRGGAWETDLQTAGVYNGRMRRPHVVNVTNVNSPIDGRPALLSPDNVTTIFHELGHGLHSMLTRVRERSISGTSVAWDFVELPSQLNENWAFEPEVLKVYARHYETGEPIPKELVAKFKAAATFQTGYFGLRQVQKSLLDLAWHMRDVDVVGGGKDAHDVNEVDQWELEFRAPYQLTPNHGSLISPTFSHVFSGGYSAGYYSYKWADVLASDAFSVFQSAGIFDPTTSNKFLRAVLEKGGSEEAADLYRQFRGRDPDPNALLRKEGLLP
jgi:peptidyl-dipeptidase Dcp